MKIFSDKTPRLGLGCWPIGGAMYSEDGTSLGYTNVDDKESVKAVHAAVNNGIGIFDTAAAYGAGHSEKLLAKALKDFPDTVIVTKIGIPIDEEKRSLSFVGIQPEDVLPQIEGSLRRLQRDVIDVVLLHLNELPVNEALPLFEQMDVAVAQGKIKSFGWSTDFTANVQAVSELNGFVAAEYAMNVLTDAGKMQSTTRDCGLYSLIRSPLAMGLLSGKYSADSKISADDIRGTDQGWLQYFDQGVPNPLLMDRLNNIRALLETDGRTPVQGALGWLWARNEGCIPIPGARTVEQVESLAAALEFGPLSETVMMEIEQLIERDHEVDREDRAR